VSEPATGFGEISEASGERLEYQVADRMTAKPRHLQVANECTCERGLIVTEGNQRPPHVPDGGSASPASELARGAAVIRRRHDHAERTTRAAQGA
jgi:hypothetical protein